MTSSCPASTTTPPGASTSPRSVFRSGASDLNHRRETSEQVAELLPRARLVEPPWGDTEWRERQAARNAGEAPGLFVRWPLLAPILHDWADDALA